MLLLMLSLLMTAQSYEVDWNLEGFTNLVYVNKGSTVFDSGSMTFNAAFADCPVVQYRRNGVVHSIYVRTSPWDRNDFNAYDLFTVTWRNANNVLGTDFQLYSTFNNARDQSNPWTYCNYNDIDVGYPRDCGPSGPMTWQWFSMPGHRFTMSFEAGFDVWTGPHCPAPGYGSLHDVREQQREDCQPHKLNWDCCTTSSPCLLSGLGACNTDADCDGNLICKAFWGHVYSLKPGVNMNMNVCEEPDRRCAASKDNWDCCSPSNPCTYGEGDCDTDADCRGELTCRFNNGYFYGSSRPGFDVCVCEKESCDTWEDEDRRRSEGQQMEEAAHLAAPLPSGEGDVGSTTSEVDVSTVLQWLSRTGSSYGASHGACPTSGRTTSKGRTTVDQCQAFCDNKRRCTAFTFTVNSNTWPSGECTLHRNGKGVTARAKRGAAPPSADPTICFAKRV